MMKENLCYGQFGDANANVIDSFAHNPQNGARREKKFACRFCDYTSANGSHVKRHELRHTGEFCTGTAQVRGKHFFRLSFSESDSNSGNRVKAYQNNTEFRSGLQGENRISVAIAGKASQERTTSNGTSELMSGNTLVRCVRGDTTPRSSSSITSKCGIKFSRPPNVEFR